MAELSVHTILLLAISLAKCLEGPKLLAPLKKCGDLECETLICRVLAMSDYTGPDCRYLNFTKEEEIFVYVKLAGEREDLWAGSKGKDFGFFPRDAVQIEEVFISEEVEVATKESDFLCLLGEDFMFGSEDSELKNDNDENMYPYEDEDQQFNIYINDFQVGPDLYATSENTLFENQISVSEVPKEIKSASESKDWEEVGLGSGGRDHIPEVDRISPSLSIPGVQGWFGLGGEESTEKVLGTVTEPVQGTSFRSRKLAMEDENDLEKLNDNGPQTELEQDLESEFDSELPEFSSEPEKQSELVFESEDILRPQATGWFGGRFASYLGFGEEDTGLELSTKESNPSLQDVPNSPDEKSLVPFEEILTEKEDTAINDSSILSPSWLDFGFGMLGFAYANKDKIISYDGKNEEDDGVDKHPIANEFDPEKEQERKMIKMMETEDQTDVVSEIELPLRAHEELHLKTSSPERRERSKSLEDSERPALVEADRSVEDSLLNTQMVSQNEHATDFQILKFLFQIDICDFLSSAFSAIEIFIERVVAALPEDMRAGLNPSGLSWELVICVLTVALAAILLFLWRGFRSIRSRFYVGREKKLALELSGLIEEKCKILEKVNLVQKEYEGLASSLKDASFEKESAEARSLEATYANLERSKSELEDEIVFLEKELKEERSKHSEQDELMADISKKIQSLEDESKSLKSQVAEAKTTFRIFAINEERLKGAIKDALNENSQLQESQKQLLQEAEVMKEQVSERNKQKAACEESKAQVERVLRHKEEQTTSLIERLLKMKDWAAVLGEDITDDGNLELEMKIDSGNGAHLDKQPNGTLKKLIYAAKLNASLKALEGERNQIYTQLSEVDKTKEDLTEHIRSLQTEQASLQSENTQFESENQKLQQKLKVMTELYQENEMKLHRKLTVEENYRLEKEEKLSKVDEKISHATEELETYRKRAKDLEEELERTIHSYEGQIISYEKKAHDNWLAARTFERNLNDLRKENAHNRQKLTETEFKLELLEKDPYALDVPNTAFGRGSRGPENPVDHQISNERGESSYDRLSDLHRAPSDTGSLSPPWEQDRRMMIPPPGQPYSDPALPLQRQDRFYSSSGRLSGPAELRSFNMPSLDKVDGPVSSEMESSRSDTKDDLGNSNVPHSPLPAESEAAGPVFGSPPFPPVREPLFPVDPRSQFVRRGPPFPPPPPPPPPPGNIMYGAPRDYFPPRDFLGPPPPPFPVRNMYAPRGFPPYLPPRAGFFPSPPHPEGRSEHPSEPIPPFSGPAAEPSEPQET
ncbi:melanoma inhibitory activity protein 2 isoform X4 [Nannospalax galili]|uniref:melanoma inhibitory activity protein 2 isoform X4 n=1 Tax=Nannospalax galili TaxID=1026970 RepID=UPI00111C25D8|nr:melanoma inhibitory activity protein 2 isoform X4 [Nannospalax galili]